MSGFTKQAIQASFLQLLDDYPLREITVKRIAETCGINRKSFYYHYPDIPALLEEIVTAQVTQIADTYHAMHSLEECLEAVLQKLIAEKKRVLHIYQSINRDVFEQALMQACDYLIRLYMDEMTRQYPIPAADRELITGFYRGECLGLILDWMIHGMEADVLSHFHKIYALRQGTTEELLRRISQAEANR